MAIEHPGPAYDLAAPEDHLFSEDAPEETMMLGELDGFLTAIALSPGIVSVTEWLPEVWRGSTPPAQARNSSAAVAPRSRGHTARWPRDRPVAACAPQ